MDPGFVFFYGIYVCMNVCVSTSICASLVFVVVCFYLIFILSLFCKCQAEMVWIQMGLEAGMIFKEFEE